MLFTSLDPAILALCAAALFGTSVHTSRAGMEYFGPTTGVMISVCSTAVLYWALSPWLLPARFWTLPAFWLFVATGLFHPMLSMSLSFESTRRLGATVSSTVSSISPLISAVIAVMWLREALTANIITGTVGVVAGVIVLSWQGGAGMRNWINPAILFPLAAAVIRGAVHITAKVGMTMTPVPYLAGLASYSVSSVGLVTLNRINGTIPKSFRSRGTAWFLVTGMLTGCAILLMYSAFEGGDVVVVAPLVSSYPIFTLLVSLVIRRQEVLQRRILTGFALTVAGVMLIASR